MSLERLGDLGRADVDDWPRVGTCNRGALIAGQRFPLRLVDVTQDELAWNVLSGLTIGPPNRVSTIA